MIESFLQSWELFHNTYLAGWLIAAVLSVTGVVVVARNQIFIGAALSQASALGVAVAMWAVAAMPALEVEEAQAGITSGLAVAFALAAAVISLRGNDRPGRESNEAVTGWIFLASSSLSVLIASRSPHGLEEIQRLASSSLIGATPSDAWLFGGMAMASLAFLAFQSRRLLLLVTDPLMASAAGMRAGLWNLWLALWTGAAVGLSMGVSGALYTFGFLVLPPLIAKNVCRQVRPMFVASPVISLTAAVLGFVLANHYDLPPGQTSVALLALLLPVTWLARAARRLFGSTP